MSRDRFRSRGGGGGGFHRRGGGGGRGGLHDFRSPPPGMGLNQNRGPMGPGPGQSGPKPPIPPPPPHQQQQQPPPQQPPPQQPPPHQPPPHPQPHQQQQPPPPPQDSSKPVVAQGPGPAPGVGSAPPASSSAPPATPPTSGAPPGSGPGPTPTPPPAVTSAPPGAPPPTPPSSGVPTTPPQAGGPPPPPAAGPGPGPGPKQGPGPGGPKGGKMPGGPKPGGGPGLSTPGGHPKPPHRGGGEPRGGRQHHPPYHQQHHQGPPPGGPGGRSEEKISDSEGFKANLSLLRRPGEKTYTQRCRLFVGNLPADITEDEFKRLFAKYGEPGEVFINKGKGFGFIKLGESLAEIAKAELDDTPMRSSLCHMLLPFLFGNLSPYVFNELLEEAFSQFGPIERAVVIVDDRGRSYRESIVEFASNASQQERPFERCSEGVFLLTTRWKIGSLSWRLCPRKNPMYQKGRETSSRCFAPAWYVFSTNILQRWHSLWTEMEKQQTNKLKKTVEVMQKTNWKVKWKDAYHEHQVNVFHPVRTLRIEELHNQRNSRNVKKCQLRQEEERRRREEEMMIRQREMEEQMRRQREESYSRMGYMDPRERDMRMGGGGAMNMGDPYGSGGQKFPPLGGGGGIGYEANPGVPPATMSGSMMGSDMRTERFGQGGAGPVGGQGPRGMGPGTPAGYDPNKKPRF
uniref:RRM domain-containing protein n=1 Tax=Cercocebus atys TaxID=9531 RepID=A0A2K5LX96_CERAT